MSDIDLVKLKKLAQSATLGPWDYNGNCKYGVWSLEEGCYVFMTGSHDDAYFTAAANPVAILALIEQLEAAERELDELRESLAVMDWRLSVSRDLKQRWMQRAKVAETELARRDAAAGEPVAWQYRYNDGKVGDWKTVDSESECNHSPCYERRAIYTAAQPAVFPECFIRLHNVIGERHHGRMPEEVQKAFDDCSDKISLGAQPQKPVVLQGGRLKPDGKFWYDEDTISSILYQAGIEVKK